MSGEGDGGACPFSRGVEVHRVFLVLPDTGQRAPPAENCSRRAATRRRRAWASGESARRTRRPSQAEGRLPPEGAAERRQRMPRPPGPTRAMVASAVAVPRPAGSRRAEGLPDRRRELTIRGTSRAGDECGGRRGRAWRRSRHGRAAEGEHLGEKAGSRPGQRGRLGAWCGGGRRGRREWFPCGSQSRARVFAHLERHATSATPPAEVIGALGGLGGRG